MYILNDNEAYCAVPALKNRNVTFTNRGTVLSLFTVTLNSQHYIPSNLTYVYYPSPTVVDVAPKGGPSSGNTSVLCSCPRIWLH